MNSNEYKNTETTVSALSGKTRIALMLIPSFIMFLTGLIMILCAAFLGGKHEAIASESTLGSSSLREESAMTDIFIEECEYYVIREDEEGYISVYLSGGELYRQLDIKAFTLPQCDRERLEIGIPVHSDRELALYIEGFSG